MSISFDLVEEQKHKESLKKRKDAQILMKWKTYVLFESNFVAWMA
jgi:hypothetical protein